MTWPTIGIYYRIPCLQFNPVHERKIWATSENQRIIMLNSYSNQVVGKIGI